MVDDLFKEFKEGIISPIEGSIISVLFYAFTLILTTLKNITPNNSFTNKLIITPDIFILFLAIFIIALTVIESIKDASRSYSSPSTGIAKIIGTICGTILFWQVLTQMMNIIGGSQFDIVVASALAIGSPILGIYLRYKLKSQ